jgi:cell division protease FtsH
MGVRLRRWLRANAARLGFVAVILALGVVLVAAVLRPNAASTTTPPPPGQPSFTYETSWTLPELTRAIDAGEVTAISVADPNSAVVGPGGTESASGLLVAKTTSGALVPVRSGVPTNQTVDALRTLGYERLITKEAFDARNALAADAPAGGMTGLFTLLIAVVMIGLFSFLMLRVMRTRGGDEPSRWRMVGGGAPQTGDRPKVRLDDVAGVDEAKLELIETIEFLRAPGRFAALGANPVRGVLLYGPPGTGKTMLAKAVAAEADVPFFAASGSDFVEKFVGVGASRIRSLFAAARRAGKGVVFIDEIDAIAKSRGGLNSHDEREHTLNQLLVELDGFGPNENVVVIGATNRLDVLDPALLRPGRFGRKVHVPLPDREDRLAILQVHAAGKPISSLVDLTAVARKTYGFSGAMLADLLNEAAILAARDQQKEISANDVQRGWLKVAVGSSRVRSMDERERSIIAAHEAGHAVCGLLVGERRRVEEISLYQHGDALGITVSSSEDNDLPAESDLRARLVALMGGRVAEELLFSEVTGGASNDFEQATKLARQMVTRLGMGRDPDDREHGATGRGVLSAFVVDGETRDDLPSEVAAAQSRAVRSILDEAYTRARELLLERMDLLGAVAGYLYEHERMTGDDLQQIHAGAIGPADPYGWRHVSAKPRAWDEIVPTFAVKQTRIELVAPAGPSGPAQDRRRRSPFNRVRRTLPRPIHRAIHVLAKAFPEPEDSLDKPSKGGSGEASTS